MSNEDECKDPSRVCPVSSRDLIHRLERIENRMKEDQDTRHDRNAQVFSVIEEERLERMKMSVTVAESKEEIGELRKMHEDVLESLKGNWSHAGIVSNLRDVESSLKNVRANVKSLEIELSNKKAFFMGMAAAIGAVGSIIGAGIALITPTFLK